MKMENKKNNTVITVILIILTFIFGFIYCYLKMHNFGWITLLFSPVLAAYIILYNAGCICSSVIKNRNILDHLRYFLLTIFFLGSGLTFVDYGDAEPTSKILTTVPDNILQNICIATMIITTILSIVSIVLCIIRATKKDNLS